MKKSEMTAGEYVREVRESQGISPRQFAIKISKTPTFVSRFERDDDISPSEETLQTMAAVLGIDADALIFLANKVPSDLPQIVQKQPAAMAALLRTAQNLSEKDLRAITEQIRRKTES